jgi:hypothetical protein
MEEGSKKPADARKSTSWSLQKKILVAVLGIAIIALAAVLVAKFVFNVDLVQLSAFSMALRNPFANPEAKGAKANFQKVSNACTKNGLTDCGNGVCVNLASDRTNCGSCGNACPSYPHADPACWDGICGIRCQAPYANCDQSLPNGCEVDLSNDASYCGECWIACSKGLTCQNGHCLCPPGESLCGGACVNMQTDNNNCGSCGNKCSGIHEGWVDICIRGTCHFNSGMPGR